MLWGLYFAAILIAEKYFLATLLEKLPAFVRHAYTLLLVIISWVIFYFEDLARVGEYLKGMFGMAGVPLINDAALYYLFGYAVIFALAAYFSTPHCKKYIDAAENTGSRAVAVGATAVYIGAFLLCVTYLVNSTYNPFLYFRF